MTKTDLIDIIYEQVGLTKRDITKVVYDVFDRITDTILDSENVKISGFGNFEVKKRGRRIGRNPKTGQETVIPPRKVVSFRPSNRLKDEINGK